MPIHSKKTYTSLNIGTKYCFRNNVRDSIADQDPGSGAFLKYTDFLVRSGSDQDPDPVQLFRSGSGSDLNKKSRIRILMSRRTLTVRWGRGAESRGRLLLESSRKFFDPTLCMCKPPLLSTRGFPPRE